MSGPSIGALHELALLRLRFANAARAMGMTPAAIDAECAGFDRARQQLGKLQDEVVLAIANYPATSVELGRALRDVQGGVA